MKQKISSILMQKIIRGYIGKCQAWHVKRKIAAIVLQCVYRQYRAYKKRVFLKNNKAATFIQCLIRKYRAKALLRHLFLCKIANKIQVWFKYRLNVKKRKAAFRIVR